MEVVRGRTYRNSGYYNNTPNLRITRPFPIKYWPIFFRFCFRGESSVFKNVLNTSSLIAVRTSRESANCQRSFPSRSIPTGSGTGRRNSGIGGEKLDSFGSNELSTLSVLLQPNLITRHDFLQSISVRVKKNRNKKPVTIRTYNSRMGDRILAIFRSFRATKDAKKQLIITIITNSLRIVITIV